MTPILLAVAALVSTIAGTPGAPGMRDGAALTAQFNKPTAIAIDRNDGTLYVTDRVNDAVRVVKDGSVSTLALHALGTYPPNPPALNFDGAMGGGVFVEPLPFKGFSGYGQQIFIASTGAHYITKVTPDGVYGAEYSSPFIGKPGAAGYSDYAYFPPGSALLNAPTAITADERHYPAGCCFRRDVFIADTGNNLIRKVTRQADLEGGYYDFSVSTFAGAPQAGSEDGSVATARFSGPRGLAFGANGVLYVADTGNHTIRRVSGGVVTTIAGKAGEAGYADGTDGRLSMPTGIAVDQAENVYIADTGNHVIRRLRNDGVLETIAGTPGVAGFADGDGASARFNGPVGLLIANDGSLIVADTSNHVIRRIEITTSPRHHAAGR